MGMAVGKEKEVSIESGMVQMELGDDGMEKVGAEMTRYASSSHTDPHVCDVDSCMRLIWSAEVKGVGRVVKGQEGG